MKMKSSIKTDKRGFTLVEVIMVMAILGILSSLAIGKYSKTQENARLNADYVTASSIATAASIAISEKWSSINGDITISDLVKWEYLTNEPKPQSRSGSFVLVANKDIIKVSLGETQLYPRVNQETNE